METNHIMEDGITDATPMMTPMTTTTTNDDNNHNSHNDNDNVMMDDAASGSRSEAVPPADDDDDDARESVSALEDNITRKGKNAYYFAHAHRATGPEWDGRKEPKLLDRKPSSTVMASSSLTTKKSPFDMHRSNITKYAFLDESSRIKLYVELDGIGDRCKEEDVRLDSGEQSLCLVVQNYREDTPPCLSFPRLRGKITAASYKIKANRIIVTLQKEIEEEWNTIVANGTAANEDP